MEYSKKNNKPVLKHHLFPRTKGFCLLVRNLEDTCMSGTDIDACRYLPNLFCFAVGAVYDITTYYRGPNEPSIMGAINAESCSADIFVRRFPLSEIPRESDEALSDWLVDLFKEKVSTFWQLIDSFSLFIGYNKMEPLIKDPR